MKYELIKDNKVLKIKEFTKTPPILSPNKGKWLERVEISAVSEPTNLQEVETNHIITDTQSRYENVIVDKFSDIPGGPTKADQEATCLAQEFETAKTGKQSAINNLFNREVAAIKGDVMQGEVDSFDSQKEEATAYQADNTVDTPLLDSLVETRELEGLDVAELATRILAHAAAYKLNLGKAMGKKHRYEDQIKLAKTIDALEKIEVV